MALGSKDAGKPKTKRPVTENPQAEKEAVRGSVSMADLFQVKRKARKMLRKAGLT